MESARRRRWCLPLARALDGGGQPMSASSAPATGGHWPRRRERRREGEARKCTEESQERQIDKRGIGTGKETRKGRRARGIISAISARELFLHPQTSFLALPFLPLSLFCCRNSSFSFYCLFLLLFLLLSPSFQGDDFCTRMFQLDCFLSFFYL